MARLKFVMVIDDHAAVWAPALIAIDVSKNHLDKYKISLAGSPEILDDLSDNLPGLHPLLRPMLAAHTFLGQKAKK